MRPNFFRFALHIDNTVSLFLHENVLKKHLWQSQQVLITPNSFLWKHDRCLSLTIVTDHAVFNNLRVLDGIFAYCNVFHMYFAFFHI